MKFRKKLVVVDAFRYWVDPVPDWFYDKVSSNEIITHEIGTLEGVMGGETYCEIRTLEDVMRGEVGDYIIQGVKGEIYPCKADIFELTYEPTL